MVREGLLRRGLSEGLKEPVQGPTGTAWRSVPAGELARAKALSWSVAHESYCVGSKLKFPEFQ